MKKGGEGWMSNETKEIFEIFYEKKTPRKSWTSILVAVCLTLCILLALGITYLSTITGIASYAEASNCTVYSALYSNSKIAQPIIIFEDATDNNDVTEPDICVNITAYETYWDFNYDFNYDIYLYEGDYESKNGIIVHEPTVFVPVLQATIPTARCYFKSWMDWRAITYRNSRQWRMQQISYTCEAGFRRVDGLYMIALGTYFLYNGVGDVFDVTLSTGITFRAVVGDIKCDRHTDPTNRFHLSDGSVVEFVVDRQVMCRSILSLGNISSAGFPGDIVSIQRVPELFIAV